MAEDVLEIIGRIFLAILRCILRLIAQIFIIHFIRQLFNRPKRPSRRQRRTKAIEILFEEDGILPMREATLKEEYFKSLLESGELFCGCAELCGKKSGCYCAVTDRRLLAEVDDGLHIIYYSDITKIKLKKSKPDKHSEPMVVEVVFLADGEYRLYGYSESFDQAASCMNDYVTENLAHRELQVIG